MYKGDEYRLAIIVPTRRTPNGDVKSYKNRIIKTISENMAKLGYKIKPEDSYGSESYFTFSKTASKRTIELPQTYRKIQKC